MLSESGESSNLAKAGPEVDDGVRRVDEDLDEGGGRVKGGLKVGRDLDAVKEIPQSICLMTYHFNL